MKWMYKYSTDSPKEMGPYSTQQEAQNNMINHMTFGVFADGPFQKPDGTWIYKYCNEISENGPFDTQDRAGNSMYIHKQSEGVMIGGPFQVSDDRYL